MRLVHEAADGTERALATDVEAADSFLAQARGLMFRRSISDDYALVFPFSDVRPRDIHMLFVPFALDVAWVTDGTVERIERLRPWTGFARAPADTVVELPAGAADGVELGDAVRLES